jgi:hypothetical protein
VCVCDPKAVAIAISLVNRKKNLYSGLTKVKNVTNRLYRLSERAHTCYREQTIPVRTVVVAKQSLYRNSRCMDYNV